MNKNSITTWRSRLPQNLIRKIVAINNDSHFSIWPSFARQIIIQTSASAELLRILLYKPLKSFDSHPNLKLKNFLTWKKGRFEVQFPTNLLEESFKNFTSEYSSKFISSSYFPKERCLVPKNKHVAIIIPFRDNAKTNERTKHLKWLLLYMIPALIRQNIHFRFYIINQGRVLFF